MHENKKERKPHIIHDTNHAPKCMDGVEKGRRNNPYVYALTQIYRCTLVDMKGTNKGDPSQEIHLTTSCGESGGITMRGAGNSPQQRESHTYPAVAADDRSSRVQ